MRAAFAGLKALFTAARFLFLLLKIIKFFNQLYEYKSLYPDIEMLLSSLPRIRLRLRLLSAEASHLEPVRHYQEPLKVVLLDVNLQMFK